jgi:hypothetical protein
MMAKWTIEMRKTADGWEWRRPSGKRQWWGFYRTEGQARNAAKRSVSPIAGARKATDFAFVDVTTAAERHVQ